MSALLGALDDLLGLAIDQQAQRLGPQSLLDPWRGMHLEAADVQRLLRPTSAGLWLGPAAAAVAAAAAQTAAALHSIDRGARAAELGAASSLASKAATWPAMAQLQARLGLDALDVALLVIALAPDLDLRYERFYAYLQDDIARRRPNADLMANLLATSVAQRLAVLARLQPQAKLMRLGLLQAKDTHDAAELARPLQVAMPWRAHLLEHATAPAQAADAGPCSAAPDGAQPALALPSATGQGLAASQVEPHVMRWLERLVAHCKQHADAPRLMLQGPHGAGKFALAQCLAGELGRGLTRLDLRDAQSPHDLPGLMRDAQRRALLSGDLPYLLGTQALREREPRWLRSLVDALPLLDSGYVLPLLAPLPELHAPPTRALRLIIELPSAALRLRLWRRALGQQILGWEGADAELLAQRYRLSAAQIEQAASDAALQAQLAGHGRLSLGQLGACARGLCGDELSRLAHRLRPRAGFDTLVLPAETTGQLRELCARVAGREAVRRTLTLGSLHARRAGVTALFAGPSGTGKTLAAEVIAHELGLDLFCIDLSAVVSKYIGETEKNLDRVFAAAENANAVLFFDEADALFGKRSEVKDAHDRYANIEISYLLQKMERFDGLAILATNLRQNIDEAFTRRLSFCVGFPFPEEAERLRLWQSLWPARAPRSADADLPALAREHRLSGGQIRNVVLAAVHLAAADALADLNPAPGSDEGHSPRATQDSRAAAQDSAVAASTVGPGHLLHALRREYQKLGKQMALPAKPALVGVA